MSSKDEQYKKFDTERKNYTDKILNSDSNKKVVLAGPGTGKSFLFQLICEKNHQQGNFNILALSFINELINDLKKDLYGLANVKTLHSFALSKFQKKTRNLYIKLESIIAEDYKIIYDQEVDFRDILCNLINDKEKLRFYFARRSYYNCFSPNCSVFMLVKAYENDKNAIPEYSQILIDEFQDFNKLEIKLIEQLAEKNQILIAGDDDQSLYAFKFAVPSEIRSKHSGNDYESFELPFCSRCTEVTIKAFDNIIEQAKKKGFLQDRIDKKYIYFSSEEKDKISDEHPKIIVKKKVFAKTIAYYIEKEIEKIYNPKNQNPSILIICPLKKQIDDLEKRLRDKGFCNIQSPQTIEQNELLDGYNMILKDKDDNLGWRIVAQYILTKEDFNKIIKTTHEDKELTQFKKYLNKDDIKKINNVCRIIKKVNNNIDLLVEEENLLFNSFGYKPNLIALEKFKNNFCKNNNNKIYKDVPIKITTILGSKGLTSDYVFLVNFDDRYLLDDGGKKINDENICRFLVALTRAKKRIFVFTGGNNLPTYVNWINKNNYQEI